MLCNSFQEPTHSKWLFWLSRKNGSPQRSSSSLSSMTIIIFIYLFIYFCLLCCTFFHFLIWKNLKSLGKDVHFRHHVSGPHGMVGSHITVGTLPTHAKKQVPWDQSHVQSKWLPTVRVQTKQKNKVSWIVVLFLLMSLLCYLTIRKCHETSPRQIMALWQIR